MLRIVKEKTVHVWIPAAVFFLAFAMAMLSHVLADELVMPEEGEIPSIEAKEIEQGMQSFEEGEDEAPALYPNHPPIDQIPPMPMPQDTDELPASEGPGSGILYNGVTGETIALPVDETALLGGFQQGGGYSGVDGGGGIEEWPMTFYDMYEITNTWAHPWRMNAKLVMRFVDQCGSDRWFVCSGTMRDAETALTAGHCVYARDVDGCDIFDWAQEIWVYPGWDGVGGPSSSVINPYGYGRGTYLGSWTGWTGSGDLNYDVGIIGVTRAVGMLTGWFGWAYGGDCSWHLGQTYNNASYPAEDCGEPGLHNGQDMYYWYGHFDSCPSWNRLQIDTSGGCFNAGWGGMSGSGAYFIDSGNRYVHAFASTSNRSTISRYSRQWEKLVNYNNNTFIPNVRGSAFDLQALDCNAEPATVEAGQSTTLLNHLATNPTNGSASGTWTYRVYLSTNDNISSGDTLLSTQSYSWDFSVMSSVRLNMVQVTIPGNTPEGDYWIGLVYDSATDGNSNNNDTDGWDAVPIHVTSDSTSPTPNPMTWETEPYATSSSQICMVATTASDPYSPINYYHDFYWSPTGGSGEDDSGWQASTTYCDSGLSTNHQYGYRVRARDGNDNWTSYSSVGYSYTLANTPDALTVDNPTDTTLDVTINANGNPSYTECIIWVWDYGISGGYYLDASGNNNGSTPVWQSISAWGTVTANGLTPDTHYCFWVMARNGDGETTVWSPGACEDTAQRTITVTSPNGGETWCIGRTGPIRWTSENVTGDVKIEISRNGGLTWSTIISSTNNDGYYGWTVTAPASTQCRIKVSSVSDPSVSDSSDANFTIVQPYITVLSPNGGETWYIGDINNIAWRSNCADRVVDIEISRDGGKWLTIVSDTANDGSYDWTVTGPASKECLIRVSDSSLSDTSDGTFTITESVPPCEGNFNGDGNVDGSDLVIFAADFGRTDCNTGEECEGDFYGDDDVDGSDLAVFAADFGRTDCP